MKKLLLALTVVIFCTGCVTSISVTHPTGLKVSYNRIGNSKISGLSIKKNAEGWDIGLDSSENAMDKDMLSKIGAAFVGVK